MQEDAGGALLRCSRSLWCSWLPKGHTSARFSSRSSRDAPALVVQLPTGWEQGPASSHFPAGMGSAGSSCRSPASTVQHGQAEGCR